MKAPYPAVFAMGDIPVAASLKGCINMRMLFALFIGLLLGGTADAQLAEEFSPPRSNCCLANTAKSLADQLQDWNQLGRYHQANQQLKNQPADPKRVVFMGDSITDLWRLDEYFSGKAYVNRGIGGQTTPQMLVRMYPDVINLKPAVMVLLAGTNDIARNTGPMTAEMIQQDIMAMTELAQHHGIKVVLCSLLPVSDYPFLKQQGGQPAPPAGPGPGPGAPRIKMTEGRPPADILKLNAWLSDYAARANAIYVDYFTAFADEKGWLKDTYSADGLHPSAQGYKVMAPLVAEAIQKALPLASAANAQQPAGRGSAAAGRGGPQGPQMVSPQVLPDRRIVFRILAPQAQNVRIAGTDIPSLASGSGAAPAATSSSVMTKAENGVWEVTVGPVPPGSYRYNFNVDGVSVIDPRNPATSESNTNTWSLVHMPGAEFMDTLQVPRGGVTLVTYYSTALGRFRRMHVYTPPGYELGGNRFPVFYLLHGAGDSDASWSSVGRAGFILDNLIAAKKAKPMVVVMTAGHTSPPPAAVPGAPPRDEFAEDFMKDVMPYIEKNYRVLTDRPNRAMAGLSMGGSQTLNIAFLHLDKFAYIGVFSSGASLGGGQITDWESAHKTGLSDASLRKGLRLLWLSTGVDDFVLANSKSTVEMLKKNGFSPVFKESAGGHTWANWRDYLNEFAPQLFQ